VQNNTPEWLWQKVCEVYGNEKNAARQMQSFAESAEIDIIVNPNKASREKLFERLNELEIPAKLSTYSPLGIKILRRVNLLNLPEFQNGHFEIQDEGSQILSIIASQASLSLTNTPAKRVLDYCAGAGGKTLGMAFFMNKETEFVATDLYSVRLKEARMRFYRAGLESQTRILKLEDLSKKYALASFDLIMIDAPCSCLGTMRRAPDIRWRTTQKDVDAICATQAEILPKAASFLKSGGVLIYATCSILHEENEAQIEKFIAANPEFIHLNLSLEKLNDFKDNLGNFRLSPATSGTDGFFASVLKKK
jgi:16S rRNA (cytosine967-C5)-methyltransferase